MSISSDITVAHIQGLLENFSKNVYRAKDDEEGSLNNEVMEKCQSLFRLDYETVEINNSGGGLSSHYPAVIVIPEFEKQKPNTFSASTSGTQSPFIQDPTTIKLRELMTKARLARSRTRFPTPVILYKGKFVCRSSTLSSGAEMYTRNGINYFLGTGTTTEPTPNNVEIQGNDDAVEANENLMEDQDDANNPIGKVLNNGTKNGTNGKSDWPLFDNVRHNDIRLLEALNVGTIIDFMVEKKKVKFGLKVTSSEKVDKENRYKDFTLISLPYPGCEFFREFRDNNYTHERCIFDWSQAYVDADIVIPDDVKTSQMSMNINWNQYKDWNLLTITQNYLKVCLKYLQDNNSGLLIHCISGWDRTPLFVSLLRLSLWADGVIHQSLNALQILFLTLAYDWFLFGHDLPDRLTKGEDIFMFCFYALKYIQEEDFSVISHRHRTKHNSSGSCGNATAPQENESNQETFQFDLDSRSSSISGGSQQDIYQQKQFNNDLHENTNGNIANLSINQDSNSSIEILPESTTVNNYSPISKRKTSPVTVPYSSRSRQRNESTSSVGSWQLVNQSGSLRSTDSNNRLFNTNLQDSNSTLVDDDIFSINSHTAMFMRRRERLQAVRGTFYKTYCNIVGLTYKDYSMSTLGSVLGNIAERVGFSQRNQI
ncbi:myotubularin-related protein 14 isoform X2 [Contarinia nasturtii]|uniref:myotubularin-related protein 14 isoform X2 n=1 Tax=Contarinia nasturtii TaxID=265458 RepID=UPI0012D39969|nr:myotubularin-related protein 14 isoform X2 [Contarinia nasturtii]